MELPKVAGCVLGFGAILFGAYSLTTHQYAAGAACVLPAWVCLMGYTREWPFISIARHIAEAELWSRIIEEKNQHINQLEAERRMLWDKVCLLGIGTPVFASLAEEKGNQEEVPNPKPAGNVMPTPMRPSAIMRRMDRLAEARWMRKINPSAVNPAQLETKPSKDALKQ